MRLSVIVSTYNSPAYLRRTLISLECQTCRDFEVLIADDGSADDTAAVVKEFAAKSPLTLRHLWHPDQGFRKNTILNEAIRESIGDYLVFLDGDVVARRDLIAGHQRWARPNQLLSGGSQIDIPRDVHAKFTREAIMHGLPFQRRWLREQGIALDDRRFSDKYFRIGCPPAWGRVLDFLFPRSAGFVGCNSSAWKNDILRVNGFDEEIAYGVDDKDLGVRLMNQGVTSRRLKYTLVYLHLDHDRSYADRQAIRRNKRLVQRRRRDGVTWTEAGLDRAA